MKSKLLSRRLGCDLGVSGLRVVKGEGYCLT